jgi:hypothetical protein
LVGLSFWGGFGLKMVEFDAFWKRGFCGFGVCAFFVEKGWVVGRKLYSGGLVSWLLLFGWFGVRWRLWGCGVGEECGSFCVGLL